MDKLKRALQPYAVAALAAITLNARERVQAAMWRSKRNVLLLGGAGVFLYGVGSATPGALVALLARDNERHSGEGGVSKETSRSEQSTTDALKQGVARVVEGGKVVAEKAKHVWSSIDEWVSEKDEPEPDSGAGSDGISSGAQATVATLWKQLRDKVSPPKPPKDHSILTEESSDPFQGMDEAWNSAQEDSSSPADATR